MLLSQSKTLNALQPPVPQEPLLLHPLGTPELEEQELQAIELR